MSELPVFTFCDYPSLVEALRGLKNHLQLSNAEVDRLCDFTDGWTDKVLGPTATKTLSYEGLSALLWCFAASGTITIDVEKAKSLEQHWERRNASQFRARANRVSKKLLEQAKPFVFRDSGRAGGLARACKHGPTLASQNRPGGKARMRRLSKEERAEFARKGANKRWGKRDAADQVL